MIGIAVMFAVSTVVLYGAERQSKAENALDAVVSDAATCSRTLSATAIGETLKFFLTIPVPTALVVVSRR